MVLVRTSPRIPVGLLSADGWAALRSGPVHAQDTGHDLAASIQAAGIAVTTLDDPSADPTPSALLGDFRDNRQGGSPVGAAVGIGLRPGQARARKLRERAAGGVVIWLLATDGDPDLAAALADLAGRDPGLEIEVVVASWDPPGARLLDAVSVLDRLRSPGGCPWDAEQTHASLAPYLIEEAHEAADALAEDDLDALREELGDVLLQVLFHSRLAEEIVDEQDRWGIDDVAGDLVAKLIRRHPHVFADVEVSGAVEVHQNWEQIKRAEKSRTSVTEGVAASAPSLARAASLISRARRAGLPVPAGPDSVPDLRSSEELGALLLSLVTAAESAGLDAEGALRASLLRYADDIRTAEGRAGEAGRPA